MKNKFQMSIMGELTFFLGIQGKQIKQDTFVHQAKYTKDLMKKFNMDELKPVSTLMSTAMSLDPDENGESMDQREYRSMNDSSCTSLWHGQTFSSLCTCVHIFRLPPRSSHRTAVQQIFRYLKYTPKFEIWYSVFYSLDLVGFSDADFVSCGIDRKSTCGTYHFLISSLVCWSSRK
jgi:hypothetical protein